MLGMLGRTRLLSALLVTGSLFLAACQPTVNVSRATARLQPAPPAPRDPRLVPVRPSAIEGRRVFQRAQCVICHGPEGLGNGPAAANLKSPGKNLMTDFFRLIGIRLRGDQLPSRPANFHNPVAMRLNSPFSMYETVTRGRPHTAMPAFPRKGGKPAYGAVSFGVNLTDEERWHVIFHEWTYQSTPAEIRRGKRLYETKLIGVEGTALTCAACHGTAGVALGAGAGAGHLHRHQPDGTAQAHRAVPGHRGRPRSDAGLPRQAGRRRDLGRGELPLHVRVRLSLGGGRRAVGRRRTVARACRAAVS